MNGSQNTHISYFCCTCNKYLSKISNVTCKTALLRYAPQDLTTSLLRATFQIGNEITVVEISVGLYRRLPNSPRCRV